MDDKGSFQTFTIVANPKSLKWASLMYLMEAQCCLSRVHWLQSLQSVLKEVCARLVKVLLQQQKKT